ncbi:futalosine hydrolase [Streptomyces specialis]|uniref:futalosine hydrolase n=1 Tax=Streptomyces specialis TaxID=498367 RepID=UPI00099EDCE0|nr:futalosine hydrolase [Streptomyces specialis]
MTGLTRVLVVTAVPAERDAVTRSVARGGVPLPGVRPEVLRVCPARTRVVVDAVAAGAGPAAAAAGTATSLALGPGRGEPYDLVVSAGIAGGFAPYAAVGATVVASAVLAADLGVRTTGGFSDMAELGFGVVAHGPPAALAESAAAALGAVYGPVLTVSTVTGTADRATELAARHEGAVAEAMEGFGVATAASLHGVPVLEIRSVSNAVGPRDRAAWRVPEALRALTDACAALWPVLDTWKDREGPWPTQETVRDATRGGSPGRP